MPVYIRACISGGIQRIIFGIAVNCLVYSVRTGRAQRIASPRIPCPVRINSRVKNNNCRWLKTDAGYGLVACRGVLLKVSEVTIHA